MSLLGIFSNLYSLALFFWLLFTSVILAPSGDIIISLSFFAISIIINPSLVSSNNPFFVLCFICFKSCVEILTTSGPKNSIIISLTFLQTCIIFYLITSTSHRVILFVFLFTFASYSFSIQSNKCNNHPIKPHLHSWLFNCWVLPKAQLFLFLLELSDIRVKVLFTCSAVRIWF